MTQPTPELKKINIPQCIPDGMRQPLTALARAVGRLLPLSGLISDDDPSQISVSVTNLDGPSTPADIGVIVIDTDAMQAIVVEGTLAADMARDATVTMNVIDPTTDTVYSPNRTIQVHGRYVPTGKKAPSGARCAAFYNGVKWRAKVIDECVVNA